ncbi:MAG: pseudouridine-5'-phosphate glycosidase [Phycisphaerales bacterium]
MHIVNRASSHDVALETTLLVHGVPRDASMALHRELTGTVRAHSVNAALVGVVGGAPTVGMTDEELATLLGAGAVAKLNTSNLGVHLHRGAHGATTVSATMELASAAGVRVFATGGIGGVHTGYGTHLDISSDLAAFTRFPVAVVSSGVKSILDVSSTREAMETLGVPVVGYRTDAFPSFYSRSSDQTVDARFDDADDLADFARTELERTGRGILIANPIPEADEIPADEFDAWREQAEDSARDAEGRDVTPAVLANLHEISGGRTLAANIALVKSNADLAARIARRMWEVEMAGAMV